MIGNIYNLRAISDISDGIRAWSMSRFKVVLVSITNSAASVGDNISSYVGLSENKVYSQL